MGLATKHRHQAYARYREFCIEQGVFMAVLMAKKPKRILSMASQTGVTSAPNGRGAVYQGRRPARATASRGRAEIDSWHDDGRGVVFQPWCVAVQGYGGVFARLSRRPTMALARASTADYIVSAAQIFEIPRH